MTSPSNNECPICYESINNPVQLPCCNNTFCMKCLEVWKPGLENSIHGKRTCPCCRALIPPTHEMFQTIQFYKQVSLSLRIIMQDSNRQLPLPPFPGVEFYENIFLRNYYENVETTYGLRVRLFEQRYGRAPSCIPGSPSNPVKLPLSVCQAVRRNDWCRVRQFFGIVPIPPQRLNATCPGQNGNTLLHCAVQANNLNMVKALLALGADCNATNADLSTPLYYAVHGEGVGDVVATTLIRWGAKKLSAIFPASIAQIGTDHLLVETAKRLGKKQLTLMLSNPSYGKHCKIESGGGEKRGTIATIANNPYQYIIVLDDSKESVVVNRSDVTPCKPLLFDFRGIDRSALFPATVSSHSGRGGARPRNLNANQTLDAIELFFEHMPPTRINLGGQQVGENVQVNIVQGVQEGPNVQRLRHVRRATGERSAASNAQGEAARIQEGLNIERLRHHVRRVSRAIGETSAPSNAQGEAARMLALGRGDNYTRNDAPVAAQNSIADALLMDAFLLLMQQAQNGLQSP